MAVLKPKNRILTLRVSEADYQILQEASLKEGARSLSDYARDSLFRTVPCERKTLDEFSVEIRSLNHSLRDLRALLAQKDGNAE